MIQVRRLFLVAALCGAVPGVVCAQSPPRLQSDYPAEAPASSWDDLTAGVKTPAEWEARRRQLREKYLDLLGDRHKPARPPLDLQTHETVVVDDSYERRLISYQVEADERAHAYLGIPLRPAAKVPGVVALHGTNPQGAEQLAGLAPPAEKAFLDHLCRRGFVVIAPEHFVSGRRTPPEGPYETARFYQKHPHWTAVGKFTHEHSMAIDVLASVEQVDAQRIGAIGHSLGGHGAMFLAAYDVRIKAAAGNCGASFFRHNAKVQEWSRNRWYAYFKPIRPALVDGELPAIDFHEIMALIAPRSFLDVSALNDGDSATQHQRLMMLGSVAKVYELLGASAEFAFFVHGHGHAVPPESRAVMYAWLDERLSGP